MSFIPISFPTLKRRRPEKNKYVIYRARSVRMGKKLCPWSWVRPKTEMYSIPRAQFFPIWTSRPVNNIYSLLSMFHLFSWIKNRQAKFTAPGYNEPSKMKMYLPHLWVWYHPHLGWHADCTLCRRVDLSICQPYYRLSFYSLVVTSTLIAVFN